MVKRASSGVRAPGSSAGLAVRRERALSAGREALEPLGFYEFFCGGGMARAGLGRGWQCLFANDFDLKKSGVYAENWGSDALRTADVRTLAVGDLPGHPVLAWASFPCQDLSLAGMGAGLRGDRSGTFWPFLELMRKLKHDGRAPKLVVLENVCGTLTSHSGRDFGAIATALAGAGYRFGGVVIDAADFVAQSRPRLFIIAAMKDMFVPANLVVESGIARNHTPAIRLAHSRLTEGVQESWVWWNVPSPPKRATRLVDLVEKDPVGVEWHSPAETRKLLGMMSEINREKVTAAKATGKRVVGTIYKRTRLDEAGEKVQRAEVRFDDVAGCLRTPAGGSSRQVILVVEGDRVRSRLLSSRECARLMGLPDDYKLPVNYNEAYHLTGDGVVVPVVRHIAASILEPILAAQKLVVKA